MMAGPVGREVTVGDLEPFYAEARVRFPME